MKKIEEYRVDYKKVYEEHRADINKKKNTMAKEHIPSNE